MLHEEAQYQKLSNFTYRRLAIEPIYFEIEKRQNTLITLKVKYFKPRKKSEN